MNRRSFISTLTVLLAKPMGLLELTNAVIPVTGEFVKRFTRYETVSCIHCQNVIAIVVAGCTREYQSKYTCTRCHGSVCTKCAKWMRDRGGQCPGPFIAKIEAAMRAGDGNLLRTHVHRYRYA